MTFEHVSTYEWRWQAGKAMYSVRYFAGTDRLIWAAWQETREGPRFEPGYVQERADFLANGVPSREVPPDVLEALRAALPDNAERRRGRNWFSWLLGRR